MNPEFNNSGLESYAYTYGMISGMHSKFLDSKDFEVLALAVSVEEVIASLEKTDYSHELSRITEELSDLELENALNKNFIRVYNSIADSLPEEDREMLGNVVFGESDLANLKTILRGVRNSLGSMEVRMMLQPGSMDAELIERLLSSETVEEFTSRIPYLGDEYEKALGDAVDEYKKSGSVLGIEIALDKLMVKSWTSNKILSDYVKMRIDSINILNLFRCRSADIPYNRHIIPDGMHLSEKFLRSLDLLSVSESLSSLENTPYGRALSKFNPAEIDLLKMERALDEFMTEDVSSRAMLNPLTIWPVLAFIQLKKKEVKDLRVVILLKAHNYPSEKIRRMLS
ncbi:MAG: V-type ATPase subunit [Candidatus Altiarchaeota archaeon]